MPLKACTGCGKPTQTGPRCATCTPDRQKNGWKWTSQRAQIIDRDGYACQRCGRTDALQVHHRILLRDGGTDTPSNLTTLCGGCHHAEHV